MNSIIRCFWLVTLCAFISGCTTYRPASIPVAGTAPDSGEESSTILAGDTVRLQLSSGGKVSGKVLWSTSEKLALGSRANYGDEDLVIDVSEIDYAEIRNQSDGQIERAWFVSLGVAALAAAYIGLRTIGMN